MSWMRRARLGVVRRMCLGARRHPDHSRASRCADDRGGQPISAPLEQDHSPVQGRWRAPYRAGTVEASRRGRQGVAAAQRYLVGAHPVAPERGAGQRVRSCSSPGSRHSTCDGPPQPARASSNFKRIRSARARPRVTKPEHARIDALDNARRQGCRRRRHRHHWCLPRGGHSGIGTLGRRRACRCRDRERR